MKQITMLKAAATLLGALGKGIEGYRHGDTAEGMLHGAGQGLGADLGMGVGYAGGAAASAAATAPALTKKLQGKSGLAGLEALAKLIMRSHVGGVAGAGLGAVGGWYGARKLIGPASYEQSPWDKLKERLS